MYQALVGIAVFALASFCFFFVATVRDVAAAIGVAIFDSSQHAAARQRLARDPRPAYPLTNVLPPMGGPWFVPTTEWDEAGSGDGAHLRKPHILGGLAVSLDADALTNGASGTRSPDSPPTPSFAATSQPDPDERPAGMPPVNDDSRVARRSSSRARAGSNSAAMPAAAQGAGRRASSRR